MPFTPLPPEFEVLPRTIERDQRGFPRPLAIQGVTDFSRSRLAPLDAAGELHRQGLVPHPVFRSRSQENFWLENHKELAAILTVPLQAALEAGDWALARRIGAEYHLLIGDPVDEVDEVMQAPDEAMMAARRVLRVVPWMTSQPPRDQGLVGAAPPSTPVVVDTSNVSARVRNRVFIDRLANMAQILEEMRLELERDDRDQRTYRTDGGGRIEDLFYDDVEELRRGLRALIAASERPNTSARQVCLPATAAALADFCRRYAGHKGFQGLRPFVPTETRFKGSATGPVRLWAAASVDTVLDGVPTRIEVISPGRLFSAELTDDAGWEMLARTAEANGVADLLPEMRPPIQRGIDLKQRLGHSSVAPHNVSASAPATTLSGLLGPAACRHSQSRWIRTSSVLRLVCDDCFTGSVVEIPLHQLPDDHSHLGDIDAFHYAHERRGRAAIHGTSDEGLSLKLSLNDMRQRDGIIAPVAADFARRAERSLAAAPRSVGAAMNRR